MVNNLVLTAVRSDMLFQLQLWSGHSQNCKRNCKALQIQNNLNLKTGWNQGKFYLVQAFFFWYSGRSKACEYWLGNSCLHTLLSIWGRFSSKAVWFTGCTSWLCNPGWQILVKHINGNLPWDVLERHARGTNHDNIILTASSQRAGVLEKAPSAQPWRSNSGRGSEKLIEQRQFSQVCIGRKSGFNMA